MKSRSMLAMTTAGVALALVGCSSGVSKAPGSNGPTVSEIFSSMKSGFVHANSVRMSGTLSSGGKVVTVNVGEFRSGDMSGTITAGPLAEQVVSAGGKAYVYVSKKFFNSMHTSQGVPASACALMCGKYLALPASTFTSFGLSAIGKSVESKFPVPSQVPNLVVTTYQGQPAYEMSGSGVHLFVAKNEPHYLLGCIIAKVGTLSFSDWNAVPPISAPPASKIFHD